MTEPSAAPSENPVPIAEDEKVPLSLSAGVRSDEPLPSVAEGKVSDEEAGAFTHAAQWVDYRPKSSITIAGFEIPLPYFAPPEFYFMLNRRQRIAFMVFVGVLASFVLAAFIAILVAIVKAAHRPKVTCHYNSYRLPTWAVPSQYNLTLDVMMDVPPAYVSGQVITRLEMTPEGRLQKCIVMHADDMEIFSTEASLDGGNTWLPLVYARNPGLQQLTVQLFKGTFNASSVLVRVGFGYPMSSWLDGFYRTVYTTADGYDSAFGFTQFEPVSARRAFPSFDEPALKAPLQLTLITPLNYLALSNMPAMSTEEVILGYYGERALQYTFANSPPMSTYTMGWLVAPQEDMISVNASVAHPDPTMPNRTITVWATNVQTPAALQTSLNAAVKILPVFEELFGVPYALPKMDLIAVPDKNEAMENWGILAFKESEIILTDASTEADEKDVILVIAHEIAHQWFGNLVTFEDWSHLWLAEGLAQYWQHVVSYAVAPEFNWANGFFTDSTAIALVEDTFRTSRPITMPPSTPLDDELEIDSMFDVIAYEKGAAIVNMFRMSAAALDGNFNVSHTAVHGRVVAALSKMLQERAFSTINTIQFVQYIGEAVGEDFVPSGAADSWFFRPGYPLVTVIDLGNGAYNLTQEPFSLTTNPLLMPSCTDMPNWTLGDDRGMSKNIGRWSIPLTYTAAGDGQAVTLKVLSTCATSDGTQLILPAPVPFLKVNKGQDGYYRVNYPPAMWTALTAAAAAGAPELSSSDLAGLMDDAFYLSWADRIPVSVFLQLVEATATRTVAVVGAPEYGPWTTALDLLARIEQFMDQYDATGVCYRAYADWLRRWVLGPLYPSIVRWTDDSAAMPGDVSIIRTRLLEAAGLFGVGDAITQADALMTQMKRGTPIDPEIRPAVYGVVVRAYSSRYFTDLRRLYTTSSDVDEREHLLQALARTEDGSSLSAALAMSLQDSVRVQDLSQLLEMIAANSYQSRRRAWDFVRTHMNDLIPRLGGVGGDMNRVGPLVASVLSDMFGTTARQKELDILVRDFGRFFAAGEVDAIKETMATNQQWTLKNAQETCDYFKGRRAP